MGNSATLDGTMIQVTRPEVLEVRERRAVRDRDAWHTSPPSTPTGTVGNWELLFWLATNLRRSFTSTASSKNSPGTLACTRNRPAELARMNQRGRVPST